MEERVALIGGGGSSVVILDVERLFNNLRGGGAAAVSGWWVGRDGGASVDRRCCAWRDGTCVATLAPVPIALGAVTAVAGGGHGGSSATAAGRVALIGGALLWRADAHPRAPCWPSSSTVVLPPFGRDGKRATSRKASRPTSHQYNRSTFLSGCVMTWPGASSGPSSSCWTL